MQLLEELSMHLVMQLSEDLVMQLSEDLDSQPADLVMKLVKDSDMKSLEDQSYQSQFLFKDRADRFQNLSENTEFVKLFQLFFLVKEMKNIVKQTNQQVTYTDFKSF